MFSDREDKILNIISKKNLAIPQIAVELFKGESVIDAQVKVGNSLRRIIDKCEHHGLDWTLSKTKEENCVHYKFKKEKINDICES